MSQKANITLYTCTRQPDKLINAFQKHFNDISTAIHVQDEMLTITLQDQTTIQVHVLYKPRKAILAQTDGMQNYFAQAPCTNTELMKQVQLQISLFSCITGIEFTMDEQKERTNAIIGRIYAIAEDCASILLYPDMSLYTPQGTLLLNIEGKTEVENWAPISCDDIVGEQPVFQTEDKARFQEVCKEIQNKNYPCVSYMLNVQLTKETLQVPTVEEIVKRSIAIFACAVCAEGTLMEAGSRAIGLAEYASLNKRFGCETFLSEQEQAYVHGNPDEHTAVQFSWRYECCAVLLWALGLYDLDTSFQNCCDVAAMAQTIRSFSTIEEMLRSSKLRSQDELLDLHTRVLYYDWSCVEARVHQRELEGIDSGIITEQHYAMNWLCGANHTMNWDEIQCHT